MQVEWDLCVQVQSFANLFGCFEKAVYFVEVKIGHRNDGIPVISWPRIKP